MSYKGVSAEQELMRYLRDRGYECQRSAGSRGPADIIAFKKTGIPMLTRVLRRFAIQVKATNKDNMRVSNEARARLIRHAKQGGFRPMFAVRFGASRWRVFRYPFKKSMGYKKKCGLRD